MRFAARVAGIPCWVEVEYHPPLSGGLEVAEEPEHVTIEAVLDNHGRPAAWLDRKMTGADEDRIAREVFDLLDSTDNDGFMRGYQP